jgi:hypothetical protein
MEDSLHSNVIVNNDDDTELWVQQFVTPRDLLQAARRAFDDMSEASSTLIAQQDVRGGEFQQLLLQQQPPFHPQYYDSFSFPMSFVPARELLSWEGENAILPHQHQYMTAIWEARLFEIYRILRWEERIQNTTGSSNNNHNNLIQTMERNYPSIEGLRCAKDMRDNELKLFGTVIQNFATAHNRCQEAVQTMEVQATYGPIKEQYLQLYQMPLFAYTDALERLRKIQQDLMDEITAIKLIIFCGDRSNRQGGDVSGSNTTTSTTTDKAAVAAGTAGNNRRLESNCASPSFLTEASVSDPSSTLQQLTPQRNIPSTSATSTASASRLKDRRMTSELSPLRKVVGAISFADDDGSSTGGGGDHHRNNHPPSIMDLTSYPPQDLTSRPSQPSPPTSVQTSTRQPWKQPPPSQQQKHQTLSTTICSTTTTGSCDNDYGGSSDRPSKAVRDSWKPPKPSSATTATVATDTSWKMVVAGTSRPKKASSSSSSTSVEGGNQKVGANQQKRGEQ